MNKDNKDLTLSPARHSGSSRYAEVIDSLLIWGFAIALILVVCVVR